MKENRKANQRIKKKIKVKKNKNKEKEKEKGKEKKIDQGQTQKMGQFSIEVNQVNPWIIVIIFIETQINLQRNNKS